MRKELSFFAKGTETELEKFIRAYFQANGYYELKSRDGLKFTKEPWATTLLNPRRLKHDIEVYLYPAQGGVQIRAVVALKMGYSWLFLLDETYLQEMLRHFMESAQTGEVQPFQPQYDEGKLKRYSKRLTKIKIAILLVAVFLAVLFKSHLIIIFLAVGYMLLEMHMVNHWLAKEVIKR